MVVPVSANPAILACSVYGFVAGFRAPVPLASGLHVHTERPTTGPAVGEPEVQGLGI